jgi:hypothetical protein
MDAGIVGSGNIGAIAFPRLEFSAYLSCLGRTEEGGASFCRRRPETDITPRD